MLGDADIDRPLGAIKLRAGFEQIERRGDGRPFRRGPGLLIVAAAQRVAETFAAKGPSLSVAIYDQFGECGPVGSVEYLLTEGHVLENIRQPRCQQSVLE